MKKKHLLWVFICSSLFVWFVVISPLNKEDPQANAVDINLDALINGDKADSKIARAVTKRPFKNIQLGNNQSNFDPDAVEAITDALTKVIHRNNDDHLPALDEGKRADLLALKNSFGSTTASDIKYDQVGQVRGVYGSITIAPFNHKDSAAVSTAIRAIAENHQALFGLGVDGVISDSKVSCTHDVCATKLRKSFNGLPAWDHEQTVSTKDDTIFAITGVFDEPRLAPPSPYIADESSFRDAIGKHFSVDPELVRLNQAAELGIARVGSADYYAFRLQNVLVNASPYDIFIDAETGNVAKALTLAYESAVSASGTAIDGSKVSFQANQNGSSYQMVDSRFPLGYKTLFFAIESDSVDLIESSSPNSGWPVNAVSALAFTKETIDYFKDNHNYDAVDPDGANLLVGFDGDKEGASFNSYSNQMELGTGEGGYARSGLSFAAAKDVVGHELTHGVVAGSSGLRYEFQSGALNESFSDFFGSMIDGDDWDMGEDLLSPSGKPTRNMAVPADSLTAQPSHYSEYQSLSKSNDNGGVHIYSGIPNRALYLLAEGLSEENLGVSIGRGKTANLAFLTMTGLTPSASFDEAAEYMASIARIEYASEPEIYDATVLAWRSVGLPQTTITTSSVLNSTVSSQDITAVAHLKPYYSTSSYAPEDNYYSINIQFFLNSNPEFNSEDNFPITTDQFSKYTRPVLFSMSDTNLSLIYQRKVDDSYYLWTGSNDDEIFLDDGSNIAGIDGTNSNEMIAISVVNTNKIVITGSAGTVVHEIIMPSTAENTAGQPVTYIDVVRFDPTGRFVVFDFYVCALGETDCSSFTNGNWSIGILDVVSGLVEFPFPSKPARFDIGFPAFSNLTDRYITLDVVEKTEDEGVRSAVIIFDRRTGDATRVSATDLTTEKFGAYGYPSFSADDTSIVYSVTYDNYEVMANALLDDYEIRDVETPISLLNPSASFKSYAAALPESPSIPLLSLSSASLDFGDVIRSGDKSLELCLENKGSFPIDVYDSSMPMGFKWDGDNRTISEGESVCSPVVVSSTSRELGSFGTTFSIIHNGANSPTPVSLSGIVDIDTDLDGIANNKDTDDDGDGTADDSDAFPLDPTEASDTDSDGIGNNADSDDDGDGVADEQDAFPLDSTESGDYDNDDIGDNTDTDDGTWTYLSNGVAISITGCSTTCASDLNFPLTVIGLPVTGIADHAFREQNLSKITIPSGLKSIGYAAFYNNRLTSLEIPDSVISIGDYAFYENEILESILLPNGLESIGYAAFYNNGLTNLEIPDSVISIGEYAFRGNKLTSLIIPEGITQVSDYAFALNELLESVVLPDSLTSIGNYAFALNELLESVVLPNDLNIIGNGAFYNNTLTSVEIPNSVTSIGESAFALNEFLITVSFAGDRPNLSDSSLTSNPQLSRITYCSGTNGWPGDVISNGTRSILPVEDCDGDGVIDGSDAFPLDPVETLDTDLDGTGNNADTDDDGDGVEDASDFFPLDSTETLDDDADGIGNNSDINDNSQTVTGELSQNVIYDRDNVTLTVTYSVSDDAVTTGLGLRLHFDSSQVSTDESNITDLLNVDSMGIQIQPDTNDLDNDPLTDEYILAVWSDSLSGSWPSGVDQPAILYKVRFTAQSGFDGTKLNFSRSSYPRGYSFNAEALILDADSDTDSDGVGNNSDTDDDNDSVLDSDDAFPLDSTETVDTDLDGVGNNADTDDDGDGVDDISDAFPLDSTEAVDTDLDGEGNNSDSDDDGDGVEDNSDAFPLDSTETLDTDLDGIGDNADTDDDGDGVGDRSDAFPLDSTEVVDTDFDGIGNNADTDDDGDGVPDNSDALPLDPTETVDADLDGIGNNTDAFPNNSLYASDSDLDGMPNAWEVRFGLDPNDASDAMSDQDNDGVSAYDEFIAGTIPAGSLDLDGNGQYDALTDGLLLLRGMFGLSEGALISGAVASDAAYTSSGEIVSRIDMLGDLVDIDGNDRVDALTDGLIILRYLFGLRGDVLINGVIASDATITSADGVGAKMESLMPAL